MDVFIEFVMVTQHGDRDERGLISQLISTLLLPTQPMNGCTTSPGSTPLLFTNSSVGSLKCHKNQNSERVVRRGPRFFVLI